MAETVELYVEAWEELKGAQHLYKAGLSMARHTFKRRIDFIRPVVWRIFFLADGAATLEHFHGILASHRQDYHRQRDNAWRTLITQEPPADKDMGMIPDGVEALAAEPKRPAPNDPLLDNPLSQADSSSWQHYFNDRQLRDTIVMDVERSFPDLAAFRSERVQKMMLCILFVYCKETERAYYQGMHDLLAPLIVILVLNTEKMDKLGDDDLTRILDPNFVEADCFAAFVKLMDMMYVFFTHAHHEPQKGMLADSAPDAKAPGKDRFGSVKSALLEKLDQLFHEELRKFDGTTYRHLRLLDIEPQIFGLRWIRLLFGREFHLDQLLLLWEWILSPGSVQWADEIFLSMIICIRDGLLRSDASGAMQLLMRYPQVDSVEPIANLAYTIRIHPARVVKYLQLQDSKRKTVAAGGTTGGLGASLAGLNINTEKLAQSTQSFFNAAGGAARNIGSMMRRNLNSAQQQQQQQGGNVSVPPAGGTAAGEAGMTDPLLNPESEQAQEKPSNQVTQRSTETRMHKAAVISMIDATLSSDDFTDPEKMQHLLEQIKRLVQEM
eukprot:Clim_evm15s7 gene=Clim_evmTU15s7